MQKENRNKNLLRSNAGNQRKQIQPRRDIENRRVRDKIYCKDTIENGGHLSLLPTTRLSPILNAQPSTLNSVKEAWLRRSAMRVNNPHRSPVGIHGMSLIPSAQFLINPKFTEPEKTFLCMDLSRRTQTQ